VSRETESRPRRIRTTGATLFLWSVLAALQGSCGTQQVSTPTRSLDRPSDAALFCVDNDLDYTDPATGKVNHCLPQGDKSNPEQYLDDWCNDIYWRDITPTATVLSLTDCDESHIRLHNETYMKDVRDAARALGRDPEWPCCPSDNLGCGTKAPACTRRAINIIIANTSRGELAVANTQLQPPGLTTIGRLDNLHGGQPGYGFLPTGILPEHVRSYSPPADILPDGSTPAPSAWAVTTNVGSDLRDPRLRRQLVSKAVAPVASRQLRQQGIPIGPSRLGRDSTAPVGRRDKPAGLYCLSDVRPDSGGKPGAAAYGQRRSGAYQ
jgi:hypothetical protein